MIGKSFEMKQIMKEQKNNTRQYYINIGIVSSSQYAAWIHNPVASMDT